MFTPNLPKKKLQIHLDGCTLGFPEALFTRSLSPSFASLTQILVRDCPQITDKLARDVAKAGVLLEVPQGENESYVKVFDVAGCEKVTVQSVFPLMEFARLRRAQQLTLNLQRTTFNSQQVCSLQDEIPRLQLASCLHNPLLTGGKDWRMLRVSLQLGFEKSAILLENKVLAGKCILLHV